MLQRFNNPLRLSLLLPVALTANHLGRVVVQQDFIPSAVVGRPVSYQCAAAGQGGSGYSYVCTPPNCVMPPGLSIDSAGLITGTPQAAGSTDTQMGLSATEGTITQGLRVEVIRAEAWDNWCARGHFGGNVSAIALSPVFSVNQQAMAGATNGGLLYSNDHGISWTAQDGFGPLPVGALVADQCADPMKVWAVTLPANRSWTTDVGPQGNTAATNPGSIYSYVSNTAALESQLPGTWTGRNRAIRQAYLNCQGATGYMVASDDEGGVLFRGGTGVWSPANTGLPVNGGKINARDVAYGHAPTHNFAAALISYPDNSVAAIYRTTLTSAASSWSLCANLLSLAGATGHWQALGITAPGASPILLAGTSHGEVALQTLSGGGFSTCSGAPTLGPGLFDGTTQVFPAINGFIVPACYTGAAGNRPVYAFTDGGVYYTPDVLGVGARFQRIGQGLLSEEIAAMGFPVSATCADNRMVLGTRRQGVAHGDASGFCHGRMQATASFNAIAAGQNFNSPGAVTCGGSPGAVPVYAGSASNGVYRSDATGKEFFTAGDTRELVITDITAAASGASDVIYTATNGGVYQTAGASPNFSFTFTAQPLVKIRAAPTTASGRAYGISTLSLYASDTTPIPWSKALTFPFPSGTGASDLAAGGSLTTNAGDDEMWVAFDTDGLIEIQNIAGLTAQLTQNGLPGLGVRRVAASQLPGVNNAVFVQVNSGGVYSLRRGVKNTTPSSQITFATLTATGLPTNEEAVQIMVEPLGSGATAYLWVLLPTQGLYYSGNSGSSFTRAAAGLPANYIPRAILPARDFSSSAGRFDVALLVAGKGVYYSQNGGATFCFGPASLSDVPPGIQSVASRRTPVAPPLPTDDIIAAGTDHGVFFSDDNGAHWHNRSPADQRFSAMLYHPLAAGNALLGGSVDGVWRSTDDGLTWVHVYGGGAVSAFAQDTKNCSNEIVATLPGGLVLLSTNDGASFAPQTGPVDGAAVDRADGTTCLSGARGGGEAPDAVTAPFWMAGVSSGASWSATGTTWSAANGGNPDYLLPAASGFASVRTLGGSPSKVLIGHASGGLYRTLDGGDSWRKVSGPGSGLEASSQNAAALLTAVTASGGTDVLVGMAGATTGGVYLSGDSGEHWTILNNGFDPNSLNITTLVKTSCSGCPVQYYTGSYGSGVYTRTIAVVPPPTLTGWCFGVGCNAGSTCVATPPGGPEQGGHPLKLCGTGFLALPAVELDGVPATGCAMISASVITCTGTPPHVPGAVAVRVRNTDTRSAVAAQNYTYAAGAPRAANSLLVAKSGNNANLTWSCPGCTAAAPARVYRGQDAGFTSYLEQYNGGIAGAYSNAGALAPSANPSYFWNVE